MSLFDVIRYPISDIPTSEELSRLPKDLFYHWVESTSFVVDDVQAHNRDVAYLARWYFRWGKDMSYDEIQEIVNLRNMIKEYDEPI